MEGLFCLRKMLQKDDFMCKLDIKDTYFSVPLHQSSKKYVKFLWSRSLYEFLCLFWLRPSTSNICKTFKTTYTSNEANKYSSNNIPWRYAFDGTNKGLNFKVQRYNHLPSATSEFHFEYGEINFKSSSRNRISWSDSKLCENDTFIARTKNKTDSGSTSRPACERFITVLELTKLIGLLASTIQAVLLAQLNFRYLQQQQINALKPNGSYQQALSFNKESRKELQWWIQILKFCKCRLILQHQFFVIIKTDASKKGVGSILSRDPYRRERKIRGKGNAHKYFGIEGSEVSLNLISQTNESESSSFSNQQNNSLDVLTKNGGYWKQETFGPGQGYMGLYPEGWDYNYSRISAKLPKGTVQSGNFFPKYFIKFTK